MAGIYIHIPFCKQACTYCNFHFSTTAKNRAEVLSAIKNELSSRKNYLNNQSIESIYFGGGTPSVLSYQELNEIFETLHREYDLSQCKEITLEANPDDLSNEKLKELAKLPINRLSIGVQSFHDSELNLMNRAHSSQEAIKCIRESQDLGFTNLTIDLIYGIPNGNLKSWEENLRTFFELEVPHLSSYALTVEKKTVLAHQIANAIVTAPKEEDLASQYDLLQEFISDQKWIHYELSNYCVDGMAALHNSSYWQGKSYLGVGPSAHSYNGSSRQWNIANNQLYAKAVFSGNDYFELEELNEKERYHDALISRLRTANGIELDFIRSTFNDKIQEHFLKKTKQQITYFEVNDSRFKIREEFWLTSDEIIRKLMLD